MANHDLTPLRSGSAIEPVDCAKGSIRYHFSSWIAQVGVLVTRSAERAPNRRQCASQAHFSVTSLPSASVEIVV